MSSLSAGADSPESIPLTAPTSAGTYYYGACVDAVTNESARTNNCSTAVRVTVIGRPDLVVEWPSVTDSSPLTGASFTLWATVRNRGSGEAGNSTLRYYRSTNATIDTNDTAVGTDPVYSLSAGASSPESTSVTAPSTEGTYYYYACVDAVSGESDTANNCSAAVTVTVTAPDLVVDPPTVSDSSPVAGSFFTLNTTVRNQGSVATVVAPTLRYYSSTDATIDTSDTLEGFDSVIGLGAGFYSPESIRLFAPDAPGTYYYYACVGTVANESNTTNNCSTAVRVTVGAAPAPDLVVEEPTVSHSNPVAGRPFTLRAMVRNQGGAAAGSTTLRYYRSTNDTISTTDTFVGTEGVSSLSAGASSAQSIRLTAPATTGTYYYGACVGTVSGESATTNNCSTAVTVTVTAPDLVVDAPMVSDSSPLTGADTVTWSVEGVDARFFDIDEKGQFSFKEDSPPDFEQPADSDRDNVYNVEIQAGDSGGIKASLDVTVTVRDVNEGPEVTGGRSSFTISENRDLPNAVYTGFDPEGGTVTRWTVGGRDGGDFTISQEGVLTFRNIPDFERPVDSNRDNIYQLQVRPYDGPHGRSLRRPGPPSAQRGTRPVGERQDMQEERHERGA